MSEGYGGHANITSEPNSADAATVNVHDLEEAAARRAYAMIAPLEWGPIERARSDEDPSTEIEGWEAVTPFERFYRIDQYFGSDSLGWELSIGDEDLADFDDPDMAKRFAQVHFARMVLKCIAGDITDTLATKVLQAAADRVFAEWDGEPEDGQELREIILSIDPAQFRSDRDG